MPRDTHRPHVTLNCTPPTEHRCVFAACSNLRGSSTTQGYYCAIFPLPYNSEPCIAVPRHYYRSREGDAVLSTAMIGRRARPQDEGMPILLGSGLAYLFHYIQRAGFTTRPRA
jgi:hypothetical protein